MSGVDRKMPPPSLSPHSSPAGEPLTPPLHGDDAVLSVDGVLYRLRLTLGALAALEEAMGAGDLSALSAKLQNPSVADMILILHILTMGGGRALAIEALRAADIDYADAAAAIAKAFRAMTGGADTRAPQQPPAEGAR